MLETILSQWGQLPIYIPEMIKNHSILAIITVAVYLLVLLARGQFAYTIRWIYVLAALGLMVYGYFRGNYSILWLAAFSLVFMAVFRAVVALGRHIARRSKDRKFEKKALDRANKRRGNFETKQAYSGPSREASKSAQKPGQATGENTGGTGNPITDILEAETAPKDPLAEIEATKAEITDVINTAKIDVEEVEAALKAAQEKASAEVKAAE